MRKKQYKKKHSDSSRYRSLAWNKEADKLRLKKGIRADGVAEK